MSINTQIEDGLGSGRNAQVTPGNALLVQNYPAISGRGLPAEQLTAIRLLRQFLTTSAGATSMIVAGTAANPFDFEVRAEEGVTKWVTGFRMNVESNNFNLGSNDFEDFGAVSSPLTNGVEIFVVQGGFQVDVSAQPIRTLGNFLNYTDEFTNFINAVGSSGDFFQAVFAFDQPVVLPEGTQDKLVIRIQDDLTSRITTSVGGTMNAIAQGYQESV
jgi:hypothetical protein